MKRFLLVGLLALPGAAMAQDKAEVCTDTATLIADMIEGLRHVLEADAQLTTVLGDQFGPDGRTLGQVHAQMTAEKLGTQMADFERVFADLEAYCAS